MKNILSKVIELTNYQNQTIDFDSLTNKGYDTVLLECGGGNTVLSDETPLAYFETHYNQAITANFKIGYYFWVYSNVDPKIQAQEYFNLVKDKKANCKLMLDVELGSVENTSTGIPYGYYNNMTIEEITIGIIEELKILMSASGLSNINDKDFIVYSSRDFFEKNLANILDKYLLWVADPTGVIPNIDTTIICNGETLNWVGYQWMQNKPFTGVGASCDLDVFKSAAFFSTPIIFGKSTGSLSDGEVHALKVGTEVKITSGRNFAPNLIPSNDKGIKYTVDSIDGSMCKLNGINEWVNFEFLNLIQSLNPIKHKSPSTNSNNLSWDNLPLETKTSIFIASNEGFSPGSYPSGGEIGYSTGNYQQYMQGIKLPITPMNGITLIERWISPQISTWNKWINDGGLNLDNLTDNQKIALYDFAYNTGGATILSQLTNCISTRTATFDNTFGSFEYVSNPAYQQGIDNRRKSEFNMYFNGPSFGSSVSELPSQYYTLIKNL